MKDDNSIRTYKENIFRLALFTGELMLKNGAETYRVEDTLLRICNSRGFKHVNVFASPTVIIISDERFDGITFMKTIRTRGINLDRISAINSFSRDFVSNVDMDVLESIKTLKSIEKSYINNKKISLTSTGLGSAFFALLLGGNFIDFIITFIVSMLALIFYERISRVSEVPFLATLAASCFIASCAIMFTDINIINEPNMVIVGSIMPLLPGVSLTKSVRDLISGELISGVTRAFEAAVISVSIATGVGAVLQLWVKLGGVV
jgi:uncharacterized membrane protein YjjP (DUF1212 family)